MQRDSICDCGSGKMAFKNFDARGIYLCQTCPDCHQRKMGRYRKDVLTDPNYHTDEPIDEE